MYVLFICVTMPAAARQRRPKKKTTGPFHRLETVKGKFKFSRTNGCYTYEARSLRGVCPFVRSCLLEVKSSIPRASRVEHRDDDDRGNETKYASKLGGAARGKYVHKQLKTYCETLPEFRPRIKLHRLSRAIIDYVSRKGWVMVDGDVPAWWLDARMGTCVDLVCRVGTTHGYVLIEIKTGYSGDQYTRSFGSFSAVLDATVPASLHTMHLLQLLSTVVLFNKAHPQCPVVHACVLHATGEGSIREYAIVPSIGAMRGRIEQTMLTTGR